MNLSKLDTSWASRLKQLDASWASRLEQLDDSAAARLDQLDACTEQSTPKPRAQKPKPPEVRIEVSVDAERAAEALSRIDSETKPDATRLSRAERGRREVEWKNENRVLMPWTRATQTYWREWVKHGDHARAINQVIFEGSWSAQKLNHAKIRVLGKAQIFIAELKQALGPAAWGSADIKITHQKLGRQHVIVITAGSQEIPLQIYAAYS